MSNKSVDQLDTPMFKLIDNKSVENARSGVTVFEYKDTNILKTQLTNKPNFNHQISYYLEDALNKSNGNGYVVAEEYFNGTRNTFRYRIYSSFADFKQEYNSLKTPHFHELLKTFEEVINGGLNSGPGRLVFDIDITEKLYFNHFVHETFEKDFEDCIKLTFSTYYINVDINRLEFVWQSCKHDNKYSKHLTVKNALFVDFRFELPTFYKLMLHVLQQSSAFYYLPENYFGYNSKFLDTNVAHLVQFRMTGSSKIKGNPLTIVDPKYSLEDTLVRPKGCVAIILEQNVGLLNEAGQLFINNLIDDKLKRSMNNNNQVDPNNLSESDIVSIVQKLSTDRAEDTIKWKNAGACLKHLCDTEAVFQAWVNWSRHPEKYQNVTEREYRTLWSSFKPSEDWRWSSQFLLGWVLKDSPDEMREWLKEHPGIKVRSSGSFKYQPYQPPRNCRIRISHINQDRINPYDMSKIIELIKSKMDSGKTYQLFQLILNYDIRSAIFTSARESFAISFYDLLRSRMNEKDNNDDMIITQIPDTIELLSNGQQKLIPGYIEFKSQSHPTPKRCYLYNEVSNWSSIPDDSFIVIQMESLWKLKIKPPQLFVCDECTSCIAQFSSKTMKYLSKSWAMFEWLLRNSSKIIFMDAFIDYRAVDVLLSCRDNDIIHIQWNHMKRGSRRLDGQGNITALHAYKFLNNLYLTERMVYYAHNHWNLYVVCGSKAKAQVVYDLLSSIGPTLLHTSDTTDEDRPKLRNVNTLWIQYRFVVITSTITNGIDFTQKHFDAIFCFGDSRTCTVRDTWQMIGRVRFVRQGYLFYSHFTRGDKKPTKYQTIKQIIINKVKSSHSVENELKNGGILPADYYIASNPDVTTDSAGRCMFTYVDDCLTRIHIRNKQEINMSRNYYDQIFDFMLQEQGISYETIKDELPEEHPFKEDFFETVKDLKEVRKEDYKATPSITPEQATEYQEHVEKRISNSNERAALEKYHFEKYLQDDFKGKTDYKMFKFFSRNKVQLLNGLRELRGSISDTFMQDYYQCKNVIQSRIYFDQETIVRVFCNIVGIPNTITSDIKFNTLHFEEVHFQLGQKIVHAFCMAPRVIKTVQSLMSVFETMLKRWTGTLLKADNERETIGDRRRYTEYTLIVQKIYLKILSTMKPLNKKEIKEKTSLDTQQIKSIAQQIANLNQPVVTQFAKYVQSAQPFQNSSQLIQPVSSKFNILELLVDFGLKHTKSPLPIPALHLTNCIREKGYRLAFSVYKIQTRNVTSDLDKYLSSFNTSWKSQHIIGDTKFVNVLTKYDVK